MTPRTKTVLGYIGIGVAAALIGGSLVWALMSARMDKESERADTAAEQVAVLESRVDSLAGALDAANAPAVSNDAADAETAEDIPTAVADTDTSTTEKQFCFVRGGVWEGETPILTVDYAQMLDGAEAAAAAAAHGDESPPPNDYYIVNDNQKLREFPADKGISVKVTSKDEGVEPTGYTMPFGQWYDVLVGMSGGDFVKDRPYWITIDDGTIVAIEEQFLP